VRKKICEGILEGLTIGDAAALAGVGRQTVNEWRRRGEEEPDGPYGEFSEAFELAKLQSKKGMIQKLLRHEDPRWTWKLMCNRWPEEFRDRIATEVIGPDGGTNPFRVEINSEAPEGGWDKFWKSAERRSFVGVQENQPAQNGA